ncbi:hypothetical protein Q5P01_020020 [Channa striata]|uniref:Uncharacterized protein n=1 Tax=Channa striata TaxID=64152 RepID=A0AA88SAY4_CHASR|nr:hypothetical protein Q5P01_020020 [Channa striata]
MPKCKCKCDHICNPLSIHPQIFLGMTTALPTSDPYTSVINESLEKLENPFRYLIAESKRNKYFSQKWAVVEPVELTLGMRYDSRLNKKSSTYDQGQGKDTFPSEIYVQKSRHLFILKPTLCLGLRNVHYKSNYTMMILKRPITFSPHMKFIVRNLPTKFNSVMMMIHLLSQFHTQDLIKYSFDVILEPLLNDIKKLEGQGLSLPFCDGQKHRTISQILGNNLGIGHYFCRVCLIEKSDSQKLYSEDNHKVILCRKTNL